MNFIKKNFSVVLLIGIAAACLVFHFLVTAGIKRENRKVIGDLENAERIFNEWKSGHGTVATRPAIESRQTALTVLTREYEDCKAFFVNREQDFEQFFSSDPPDFKARYRDERDRLFSELARSLQGHPKEEEIKKAFGASFPEWLDKKENPNRADIPLEQKKFWIMRELSEIMKACHVYRVERVQFANEKGGASVFSSHPPLAESEFYKGIGFEISVFLDEEDIPEFIWNILRSHRNFSIRKIEISSHERDVGSPTPQDPQPRMKLTLAGYGLDFDFKQ